MIESNIIEWMNLNDSIQNIDIYSKKILLILFSVLRNLLKNNYLSFPINIFLIIISFLQIWVISIIFIISEKEKDIFLEILNYLKSYLIFSENITKKNFMSIFITFFLAIILEIITIILIELLNKKINLKILYNLINILNAIIFYYLIGPIIFISLSTIYCENNFHDYLNISCFYNSKHILFIILSLIIILLYIIIMCIYSIYCIKINLIEKINLNDFNIRVNCNYDLYFLISKIFIFIFYFILYIKKNQKIYKYIYLCFIFINCIIMSFYTFKNVYYYNDLINAINELGWYLSDWFVFCIIIKEFLNIKSCSIIIITGYIIIFILYYKISKNNIHLLITQTNIFQFNNIKLIEIYKSILLKLSNENSPKFKILEYGIINNYKDFLNNNPEINTYYQKISNSIYLIKKYSCSKNLPILYLIYIIYSYYLSKSSFKEDIIFNMSYFLINEFNNPVYPMYLCSKMKSNGYKNLYYKYILMEDIKEYLIFKDIKKSNKEIIKHIQIGKIILYYFYIDLFKIKIYDILCSQIDYFDILKIKITTTTKIMQNFIKQGKNILKLRKEIKFILEKIIEINPFNNEYLKDYLLFFDLILQEKLNIKEEINKYKILKNNKIENMYNNYHDISLNDRSSILLVDGYLLNGKILYASPNFSFLFSFQEKELLNLNIDDLIPYPIKTFHKELIENMIKYSNINYIFKTPKDSFLKNKFGDIFTIKLFVKPSPNLSYGLIYYNYIKKNNENNYIILLDRDFIINGFSGLDNFCSLLNINNNFNSIILGYHIGLIIPNILMLLEYKDGEFQILKTDYELKGYFYSIYAINKLKIIIDNILSILKGGGEAFNDNSNNIINEFNQLIKEFDIQQITPINIFYKIEISSFLNKKYKYYKIHINNDIISKEGFNSLFKQNNMKSNDKKKNSFIKKIIKGKYDEYKDTNTTEKSEKRIDDNKIMNNNEITIFKNKQINNKFIYNSISKNNIIFNKIKNNIIYKKEIFQITIMKYLYFIFGIIMVINIILDFLIQITSFRKLNIFLEDNLFFNRTKIILGVLYSLIINIRWYSHSLYINNYNSMASSWSAFYKFGIIENIESLSFQKNQSHYLSNEFKDILKRKFYVELYIYKYNKTQSYRYNFDNLLLFLINNQIKILEKYSHYSNVSECKIIPKELGLNEVDLKNLAEISYFSYYLNIEGYTGEEKAKIANEKFSRFPFTILISLLTFICILFLFIYFIIYLYKIENSFINKLINFNSFKFESYKKKLDEIKKQLINDNNNEEEINNDELNIYNSNIKKLDENLKKSSIKESKPKKDKSKNYNYLQKKIKIMTSFFFKKNLIFGIIIPLIMIIILSYNVISLVLNLKYKKNLLDFDLIYNNIENAFKESYDIYIPLVRELDFYESHLTNCTMLDGFYKMNIPKINDIKLPKLENLIMDIIDDKDLNKETIEKFNTILNGDMCYEKINSEQANRYCYKFWSGILLKGMRQAITKMEEAIITVLDELQTLNNINNGITLFNLMNESAFFDYKVFNEVFLFRNYNKVKYIFIEFREEKLLVIINTIKYVLIIYLIIIIFVSIYFIYYINSYKDTFNSFLNFIGIIPEKCLEEDNNMYKNIIDYGKTLFNII